MTKKFKDFRPGELFQGDHYIYLKLRSEQCVNLDLNHVASFDAESSFKSLPKHKIYIDEGLPETKDRNDATPN